MTSADLLNSAFLGSSGAARLAASLFVGFLLLRFSRPNAIQLRFWGAAWICLGIQVLGAAAELAAVAPQPPSLFFHLSALASALGAYGYLVCIILGAFELPGRRPLSRSAHIALIVTGSCLALVTFLSFYADPAVSPAVLFARRHLPLIARTIACAVVVGHLASDRPRFASGRWFVLVSLILQGTHTVIALALRISNPESPVRTSLVSVVIAGLMGLGMIACLLDHDRQEIFRASAEAVRASALDTLTGLSNQSAFVTLAQQRLIECLPQDDGLGIVFLALNRLGSINQSLGHAAGDRILRATADRLRASVRDSDDVARVGGDEFAILVSSASGLDDVIAVATKLEEVMRRPFDVNGRELNVTASIGVSVFPQDAGDADTLLDYACTAAHRVKDSRGGRIGVYSKGMNAEALERLSLEHDLRRAIERDELVLYFQPLFRLPGATVRGFEALLRWRHPRFGLIGAETIISVAESTGLIHTIGPWALRAACERIESMRRGGQDTLRLSVNVSAHQLMAPDLVTQVSAALRESGLPGTHLEIEITESAAIDNLQTAREHLYRLKEMGVSIAIDDFGTGYSSLAYLRNLPLDTIKIDRSFIRDIAVDLGDGALVTTIIALAQGRDLCVVAEGVETEEQLQFLISRGCDYAQGYLLARPLPPEDLEAMAMTTPGGNTESWTDG